MIFSFLPGTGKHFCCNILCSSDNLTTQFIHVLHFFMIKNIFYKTPEEKNPLVKPWEQGARKWESLFITNDQEIACPEKHEHDGRGEVLHHLTEKLFPQGHDTEFLMCVVPPTDAHTEICEHIRNLIRCRVWKCTDFSDILYD